MPIFPRMYSNNGKKRGVWWFNFWWNGRHVQRSTGLQVGPRKNEQAARDAEANFRALLAKGEAGILERPAAPILKDFAQKFINAIEVRCAEKPKTIEFYSQQLKRLLEFEPLANAQLDAIEESLIESFVQHRRQQLSRAGANRKKRKGVKQAPRKTVSAATVNRSLACLRRLLRLAHEWHVIDRVPRIRLLPGEQNREFILSHQQEVLYLEMAQQPLKDIAALIRTQACGSAKPWPSNGRKSTWSRLPALALGTCTSGTESRGLRGATCRSLNARGPCSKAARRNRKGNGFSVKTGRVPCKPVRSTIFTKPCARP
jgi:hypothetical protein